MCAVTDNTGFLDQCGYELARVLTNESLDDILGSVTYCKFIEEIEKERPSNTGVGRGVLLKWMKPLQWAWRGNFAQHACALSTLIGKILGSPLLVANPSGLVSPKWLSSEP